ncbi:MAG TPA: transposase [Bacteroidetes bacterium]|nr:transposase [Bacteroidota bacterium]
MDNYSKNPKRKSIRLKGYDYSQSGLYFITICVQNRECLFGKIENGIMILNELGNIANNFWIEIPEHFPMIEIHEHIIMPNHLHGIIEIVGTRRGVSLPNPDGSSHVVSPNEHQRQFSIPIPGSISTIINQYKSSVKRWCNKNGHEYFKWQSRFHDHIIRSEDDYYNISNYIINNPAKWQEDKYYGK